MTEPMFAVAGPVFSIDGDRVPSLARDCVRLEIEEGVEGLRTLRLHVFATGAGAAGPPDRMIYLDGGVVDFGKQLTVSLGPDGGQRAVFDGAISAIEAVFADGQPPLVVILAEDALMRLRMTRRLRTFTDVTDADLAHQRSEVVVTGYDASAAAVIDERAQSDTIMAEISGGRAGPQIVKKALGATTTLRVREAALTGEEAQAWAKAEMLRRARRFVSVVGTTRGSPDMIVGSRLTLQQVGAPFEGSGYYVTRIRHTVDLVRGLRTYFEAERATVNEVT